MKAFTNGTHRAADPAATIDAITPFLPEMGITRVAVVSGLDRLGVPVVNAIRPNSRSLSVSQGKGLTLNAAKASAIMEAVESFHAEVLDVPVLSGSFNEVSSEHDICDVNNLPMFHGSRFNADRLIDWISGINLINGQSLLVPAETVHTDYTYPVLPNAGCFVASTNGLASGNTLLEAQIHGICEVIERDANTLWELAPMSKKAATRIDPTSVLETNCRTAIDQLAQAGIEVALWDMTSDTGVATFYCLIVDRQFENGHSGAGAGTHPVKEIALLRALTEAVQVRTNYITGARDDLMHEEYGLTGVSAKNRHARNLIDRTNKTLKDFGPISSHNFQTFEEDLEFLLHRLKTVGIEEVISVDLSRPKYGVSVVRVIIPFLEGPHDHSDYAMGSRAVQYVR